MSQINHNAVTLAILALDLGTDTARVHRTIRNGGQPLVDTIGVLLTVESLAGMNQKAVMRAVQALSYSVNGAIEDLDKVTACVIAAVMLTAQDTITFESMRYLSGQTNMVAAGAISGVSHVKIQEQLRNGRAIKGISPERLQRFIRNHETAKTIESKVSRSVGKRGFLTGLGVTAKSDAHSFTLQPGARESGFVLAYASQLQAMTQGNFQLVFEDKQ